MMLLRSLVNVFYPLQCVACGRCIDPLGEVICEKCFKQLHLLDQREEIKRCRQCQRVIEEGDACCEMCKSFPNLCLVSHSLVIDDPYSRALIRDVCQRPVTKNVRLIATLLAAHFDQEVKSITTVPKNRAALLLARQFAKLIHAEYIPIHKSSAHDPVMIIPFIEDIERIRCTLMDYGLGDKKPICLIAFSSKYVTA